MLSERAWLKAERQALDPERARKLLRRTVQDAAVTIEAVRSIQPVKARPGRRLTIRYEVQMTFPGEKSRPRALFGKLYRGRKGQRSHSRLSILDRRPGSPIRLPRPLGYHSLRHFLLLAEVSGSPLTDLLPNPGSAQRLEAFGSDLAHFHGRGGNPGPGTVPSGLILPVHGPAVERSVVEAAGSVVAAASLSGSLIKDHLTLTRQCWQLLVDPSENGILDRPLALLHRDLHPDQILVDGPSFGLVDLDEIARGEPELDVGNLAAHLAMFEILNLAPPGSYAAGRRALVAGYAGRTALLPDRLALYEAGTLLRLASLSRLSRRDGVDMGWNELARALVDRAGERLAGL